MNGFLATVIHKIEEHDLLSISLPIASGPWRLQDTVTYSQVAENLLDYGNFLLSQISNNSKDSSQLISRREVPEEGAGNQSEESFDSLLDGRNSSLQVIQDLLNRLDQVSNQVLKNILWKREKVQPVQVPGEWR